MMLPDKLRDGPMFHIIAPNGGQQVAMQRGSQQSNSDIRIIAQKESRLPSLTKPISKLIKPQLNKTFISTAKTKFLSQRSSTMGESIAAP